MKLLVFPFLSGALILSVPLPAQDSIDWSALNGGGGTSTGGKFTVSGTIGQPSAGTASGGRFTMTGGFWGVFGVVQSPGAPLLSITRTAEGLEVSWPEDGGGWVLQISADLGAGGSGWTTVFPPYTSADGRSSILDSGIAGTKFFRLWKAPP